MIYEYQKVSEVSCDGPNCKQTTRIPITVDGKNFCCINCVRNWSRKQSPAPQFGAGQGLRF